MWAAPRSAAAAAVARGRSGPGRAGPGWSRSGGHRRRRRRKRAVQRRTEPPPPPPRPGPGGCAAPSRCLCRRSRSRSGHRAGKAGRGRPAGGRGREGLLQLGGPWAWVTPGAAFSSSLPGPSPPELGRWPTQPGPHPEAPNGSLPPPPGQTHPLRLSSGGFAPHFSPLSLDPMASVSCHPSQVVPCCLHNLSPLFSVPPFLPLTPFHTSSPLQPCPETPFTVAGLLHVSPWSLICLYLAQPPLLILLPLIPSILLCPPPHLFSPVPHYPHWSPSPLCTWAPRFTHTPRSHLA